VTLDFSSRAGLCVAPRRASPTVAASMLHAVTDAASPNERREERSSKRESRKDFRLSSS